jgi:hypothetical protein
MYRLHLLVRVNHRLGDYRHRNRQYQQHLIGYRRHRHL